MNKVIEVGDDVSIRFRIGNSVTPCLSYDPKVGDGGSNRPSITASQRGSGTRCLFGQITRRRYNLYRSLATVAGLRRC